MRLNVGFTGTQKGMSARQKNDLKKWVEVLGYNVETFHHGDCIGADKEADEIAAMRSWWIVVHPPLKENKRAFCNGLRHVIRQPKGYRERNRDIVDCCTLIFAAPDSNDERTRSGTWSTVRYARKRDKLIVILER